MKQATRRLIDASATLPPADRALLSLWTQRGLDDAAVARMTGMSSEAIVERRARIVAALSDELGLPPEDISGALEGIADHNGQPAAETATGSAPEPAPAEPEAAPEPRPAEVRAVPEPSPAHPQAEVEPENLPPPASRDERRRLTWAMLVILLAAVAVALIVILAGGGSKGSAHTTSAAAPPASSSSTVSASASASASSSATTSTPSSPASQASKLVALPGTGVSATGSVSLTGTGASRRIVLNVHGLPAPGAKHYEVFLYNSIIDSEALGALSATGSGSFALPRDAAHYGFIDISPQASGDAIPDGASLLRAPSPAHHA